MHRLLKPFLKQLLSYSLVGRLHEAFRQCQDLKTEKAQMDRKINQLSEENGDLSFKVEQLEIIQKDQTKQVDELNKKLTQHEKATWTQQQRVKVKRDQNPGG